jgi:hypothetical protein
MHKSTPHVIVSAFFLLCGLLFAVAPAMPKHPERLRPVLTLTCRTADPL